MHGKGEVNQLYYGFYEELKEIEPSKSRAFDKPVVFGTLIYLDAVLFSASWDFYDLEYGSIKAKSYLVERYPGALKKIDYEAYVHYLNPKNFYTSEKLPPTMMVSYHTAEVEKCVKVNIMEELKKKKVEIIKNEELLKRMRVEKRPIKIGEMYVPIYYAFKFEIPGAEYFHDFREIFEPVDKVIVNNFDGYNCRIIEYDCKKKYLLIPKQYEIESPTEDPDFASYRKNMMIIYADYEKMYI
jgi:hypothetical protein